MSSGQAKVSPPILRPLAAPKPNAAPAAPVRRPVPSGPSAAPAAPAAPGRHGRARAGNPAAAAASQAASSKGKDVTIGGTTINTWVLIFGALILLFLIRYYSAPRERVQRFYREDGSCIVAPAGGASGHPHIRPADQCKGEDAKWVSVTVKGKGTIHPVKNRKMCLQSNWLFASVKECKKGSSNQQWIVGPNRVMKGAKPSVCLSQSKIPLFGSMLTSSRCSGSSSQTLKTSRAMWA